MTRSQAKIIGNDNKEGYIEISLKEATSKLSFGATPRKQLGDKKVFEIAVTEANKGGLMMTWQGITGFCRLPN